MFGDISVRVLFRRGHVVVIQYQAIAVLSNVFPVNRTGRLRRR